MKKFLLTAFALTAVTLTNAQNALTVLPDYGWDYCWAQSFSPNGRYVGGTMYNEMSAFVYDVQTQTLQVFDLEDDYYGAEVRGVSNDGIGVGYDGPAKTFAVDGIATSYGDDQFLSGITADGKFIVGSFYNDEGGVSPAYWDQNGTRHDLPELTDERAGSATVGSHAYWVSADSSIIAGYVQDESSMLPPIVWRRNRDGQSYSAVVMYKDYFDWDTTTGKPYSYFMPAGLSENGKWMAITVVKNDENGYGGFARYNFETDSLEVFICDEKAGELAELYDPYAAAIANDGTIVGSTAQQEGAHAFIWEAGSDAPVEFTTKFPSIEELQDYDDGGFHVPYGISSDGRYICGTAVTFDEDENYRMTTYVIDMEGTATGINTVNTQKVSRDFVEKHFSLDGKRLPVGARGMQIVTRADGRNVKVLAR